MKDYIVCVLITFLFAWLSYVGIDATNYYQATGEKELIDASAVLAGFACIVTFIFGAISIIYIRKWFGDRWGGAWTYWKKTL